MRFIHAVAADITNDADEVLLARKRKSSIFISTRIGFIWCTQHQLTDAMALKAGAYERGRLHSCNTQSAAPCENTHPHDLASCA